MTIVTVKNPFLLMQDNDERRPSSPTPDQHRDFVTSSEPSDSEDGSSDDYSESKEIDEKSKKDEKEEETTNVVAVSMERGQVYNGKDEQYLEIPVGSTDKETAAYEEEEAHHDLKTVVETEVEKEKQTETAIVIAAPIIYETFEKDEEDEAVIQQRIEPVGKRNEEEAGTLEETREGRKSGLSMNFNYSFI